MKEKKLKCCTKRIVTFNKPRLIVLVRMIMPDDLMPRNLFHTNFNINTQRLR